MSYLKTALKVVKQDHKPEAELKIRLVEKKSLPMTEARRQSLQTVMDATILTARDRIIESHKGRQFRATDETRKAEASIEHLHQEVLNGQSSLAEYQTACERWARLCVSEIERKA
jgi:hypothetical protein